MFVCLFPIVIVELNYVGQELYNKQAKMYCPQDLLQKAHRRRVNLLGLLLRHSCIAQKTLHTETLLIPDRQSLVCFNNSVNNKVGLHEQSFDNKNCDCNQEQQQTRNNLDIS